MSTITHIGLRPNSLDHESQTNNLKPMNQQFVVTERYTILHEA